MGDKPAALADLQQATKLFADQKDSESYQQTLQLIQSVQSSNGQR